MDRALAPVAALAALCVALPVAARDRTMFGSVRGTPHDLNPTIGGAAEGSCDFCHTGHKGGPEGPLWNVSAPRATYRTYEGRNMDSRTGQPLGSSKLCLSCHDGTLTPTVRRTPGSPSRSTDVQSVRGGLGMDLSNDHPISVAYPVSGAGLRRGLLPADASPSGLGGSLREDLLDEQGLVQCTSCHDAHGNLLGKFLLAPTAEDRLCRTCHSPLDWDLSAHATDRAPGRDGGCMACHVPHDGVPGTPLLRDDPVRLCVPCHADQARNSLGGSSRHVDPSSRDAYATGRAMLCSTCHDPHVVRRRTGYERRFLTDPRDPVDPPHLLDSADTPWNGASDPYKAVTSGSAFCLLCHDGTWPGAVNIRAETGNRWARQSEFAVGNTNLHFTHAPEEGGVGCTYCHDVHGSPGALGVPRGAALYPWLNIREFPYRSRQSCGATDPGARCH